MAKKLPLVVFAFDLLYLNGKDITPLPYSERRKQLERIIHSENLVIRKAEEKVMSSASEILEFFNKAVSEGLEGLMLKKLDAAYKAGGRGFHWIKFKRSQSGELTDTVDCVLLGVYRGRGKRTEFGVGGLLVGIYNEKKDEFETISRIGTGVTDEEFLQYLLSEGTITPELCFDAIESPKVLDVLKEKYWDLLAQNPALRFDINRTLGLV